LLHSVDLPLPAIPRTQQLLLSDNLNSSIFFNTFFSGFSWIKLLVLGKFCKMRSDSGILEILTPPISVDKIGSLSGFSTIIVSVKIALTHPPTCAFLQLIHYIYYKKLVRYSDNVYFFSN